MDSGSKGWERVQQVIVVSFSFQTEMSFLWFHIKIPQRNKHESLTEPSTSFSIHALSKTTET